MSINCILIKRLRTRVESDTINTRGKDAPRTGREKYSGLCAIGREFYMKKILRWLPIFAMMLLLVATTIFGMPQVASAEGEPAFRIVGKSDTDWTLYVLYDGEEEALASSDKEFFEYGNNDVAGVAFLEKINEWLAEKQLEEAKYTVSFELPSFDAQAAGTPIVEYSETRAGGFCVSAPDVDSCLDPGQRDSMTCRLQYRRKDSPSDYSQSGFIGDADTPGDPIFFGRVDTGEYYVRYVVTERFQFPGDTQNEVSRFSTQEFECKIVPGVAPTPDIVSWTTEYGTRLGDVNIRGGNGSWTLSAQQDGEMNADTVLNVADGQRTVYFDFASDNQNYLPLERLPILLSATPRSLSVAIGNMNAKLGEPLKDLSQVEYYLGGLADGDSEEDLGLEFYIDGQFDPNTAGFYIILARISNQNYTLDCRSLNHNVFSGGKYTVFQFRYDVEAEDGRKFSVFFDGLEYVDVRVNVLPKIVFRDGEIPAGAKDRYFESVAAYEIGFYSGENRTYPDGEFTVEWQGAVEGAQYVAFDSSRQPSQTPQLQPYDGGLVSAEMSADKDTIAFFGEYIVYPPENVWQWYNILLLTVCAALAATAAILAIAIAKRRGGPWK